VIRTAEEKMAGKPPSVKRYVARLEPDERERLAAMVGKGAQRAQVLTKARILLKADVSEAGERATAGSSRRSGPIHRRFIARASNLWRKASTRS
jgi:hypothetical protein